MVSNQAVRGGGGVLLWSRLHGVRVTYKGWGVCSTRCLDHTSAAHTCPLTATCPLPTHVPDASSVKATTAHSASLLLLFPVAHAAVANMSTALCVVCSNMQLQHLAAVLALSELHAATV
jgi:hypothetical protein